MKLTRSEKVDIIVSLIGAALFLVGGLLLYKGIMVEIEQINMFTQNGVDTVSIFKILFSNEGNQLEADFFLCVGFVATFFGVCFWIALIKIRVEEKKELKEVKEN